ncbi:MAG TPA: IS1595 family transposase [Candidatus Saccharimonadales bacterium]|nr:IS1595 family transposase [Candidatus Saccharimonadales bacterium]
MDNLLDFYKRFATEDACIDYLEQTRWGDSPICPRCGCVDVYRCRSRRIFKCTGCEKQFTARIGTIFEESRLPLQKWFLAIYLLTSHKKGVSSIQISKHLGITQKSAWHMLHRIRYAVTSGSFETPLQGTVEIDETYIGGKHRGLRDHNDNKAMVIGIVEKNKGKGRMKAMATKTASATVALPFIRASLIKQAKVQTDESKIYHRVKREWQHETINHSEGEYAKAGVTTNTIEGAWMHLKASLDAIYIGVSPKHLQRYCDEYCYRYSTRDLTDSQRFELWFQFINGKRLKYKQLVSK